MNACQGCRPGAGPGGSPGGCSGVALAAADARELLGEVVHVVGQQPVVVLEREPRGLDLQGDPQVGQVAQLLGAEQVAQQVAVERQRRRPALGQRGVALVHVDGDPAEEQRAGER